MDYEEGPFIEICKVLERALSGPQTLWAFGIFVLGIGAGMALRAMFGEKNPIAKRVPFVFYGLAVMGWAIWTFPWTAAIGAIIAGVVFYFRKYFTQPPKSGGSGRSGGGSSTP